MKHLYVCTAFFILFTIAAGSETTGVDSTAGSPIVPQQQAGDTSSESDLTLWEVGGMYFCLPYANHTFEADINAWYEPGEPGISLYGSYAFTDNFTLKLELPFAFSEPIVNGFKITGLYGKLWEKGDAALSGDLSIESYFGDTSQFTPLLGVNAAKRWGIFALFGRLSGGADIYTAPEEISYNERFEAEVGPFVYTGQLGMIGLPVMFEYPVGEEALPNLNLSLDWEIYLPLNISLYFAPRYEVLYGQDLSALTVWFGVAWMLMP